MTPEEEARKIIDEKLESAGWIVQDRARMDLSAGPGVAVREFPLKQGFGEADYMLYADRKAVGVIEAKPRGHTLTGVEVQSATRFRSLWRRGKTEAGSDLSCVTRRAACPLKPMA